MFHEHISKISQLLKINVLIDAEFKKVNFSFQRRQDNGMVQQEGDGTITLGDTKTLSKCSYCTKSVF